MYIAYVDESGCVGSGRDLAQPVQAMACVLTSAYNLPRTTRECGAILEILRDNQIPLEELKAQQVYRGRGPWRRVDGEIRHEIFHRYLMWLVGRRHRIVLSLIDNDRFFQLKDSGNEIASYLGFPYVAGALQIALAIQKLNKGKPRNKGKTILIFDKQDEFQDIVEKLLAQPPEFTDAFYRYESRIRTRLNQLIDTAYFVNSNYSYLVQTADMVAFVSRLYVELTCYGTAEAYPGETDRIQGWFGTVRSKLIRRSCVWPRGSDEILQFYGEVAPRNMPF